MPALTSTTDLALAKWLISDAGIRAATTAAGMRALDLPPLRIGEQLRKSLTPSQASMVQSLLDIRDAAQAKFTDADRLFFTRPGLEQSTSEPIAHHRAARFAHSSSIIDLCCGIGGDLLALASDTAADLVAVDADPVHALYAEHNVRVIVPNRRVKVVCDDVRNVRIPRKAHVFIDPARRTTGGRMRTSESEPPLEWAIDLAGRTSGVAIKTAPGISHDLVPDDWELEIIGIGFDVKEAVLWSPSLAAPVHRTATVMSPEGTASFATNTSGATPADRPLKADRWLVDLNPVITNSGLVRDYAGAHELGMIDDQIGFLVAENEHTTPFARSYRILAHLPWNERDVKRAVRRVDGGPVDVRRRGLPGDVDAISKRIRGRGDRRLFVAMTRMNGKPWAIVCEHVP